MCIICEAGYEGDDFIAAFERTRKAMQETEAAMLKITQMSPDLKAKYDHAHKALVRARKVYNRIESIREKHVVDKDG